MTFTQEEIAGVSEGQVAKIGGKNYFIEKKIGNRNIAAVRWYWWDTLAAKVVKALGGA